MNFLIKILSVLLTLCLLIGCAAQAEQPIIIVEEPVARPEEEESLVEIEVVEIAPVPVMEIMNFEWHGVEEQVRSTQTVEVEVPEEEEWDEDEWVEEEYEEDEEEIIEEEEEEEIAAEPEIQEESHEPEQEVEEIVEEEPQVEEVVVEAEPQGQYWAAQYVWDYFTSLGYNQYVVAGLLGNMMCECAHQNLELYPEIYGSGYYGICQWSEGYAEVWGKDLAFQCEFLARTLPYEMDTYGCGYEAFCALQNEQTAAIEFAEGYERCGSGSHWLRAECATTALNYFGN